MAGVALFSPLAIESADAAACTVSVNGNSGPVSNSAAINCIFINNATVAGNVTNTGTGTINAPGPGGPSGTGIVVGNSTINGAIINNGSITAVHTGILTENVTTTGGITNTGTISAGAGDGGINLLGSFSGPVNNTGTISGGFGIEVSGPTYSGGVTNSGSINAIHDGIAVEAVSSFAGGITNSGTVTATNFNAIQINNTTVFSGGVTNSGTLVGNEFGIYLSSVSTFSGGITNTGAITGSAGIFALDTPSISIFNSGTVTGTSGNAIQFDSGVNTLTLGPGFAINGNVVGVGSDILQLGGTGTGSFNLGNIGTQYTGFATFNVVSGTWVATGTGSQNWTIAGGTLQLGNGGTSGAINGNIVDNGTFAIDRSDTYTFAGNISGTGSLVQMGPGTTVLSGASSYTGPTNVTAGTLQAGAANVFAPASSFTISAGAALNLNSFNQTIGSLGGAGNVTLGSATLNAGGNNANTAFSGAISGGGGLTKAGSGTLILSGSNGYAGATNINGGTLEVDGAITSSSNVTVNVGGKLTGSGTVDPSTITIASGATFAPGTPGVAGTSMTVAGNLAFQSGAMYLVQISPTAASSANVTGTASLAGTVQAVFASGSYLTKQYDILHSAGLGGSTFTTLTATNLPAGFAANLSYTATDVLLNLTSILGQAIGTGSLNWNQQNVVNSLNSFFNNGGTLPASFLPIFSLSGPSLGNALSQIDGEDATGAERGAFEMMNEFLGLMVDPFVYGRDGGPMTGGGPEALGFAPDQQKSLPPNIALAYADALKAPPSLAQRWTAWGAGFGGSATANGDPAVGSNNVTTSTYGYAAGMDYHYSPDTVLGFALAGGGTNWNLTQGLGTGRSDAVQAGLYGVTHAGPAYVAAALAFANNWFTTNRTAFAGDQLTANFQGQSYGARLEGGGYRFAMPYSRGAAGITPYAAIQAQDFHTPSYSETDLTGGGFGLSYSAMSGTDTRSELGSRFDTLTAWGTMPVQLRAKVAWAHDWVSNPALGASFESLPGTGFTVNGAPIPHNSALASAGAQLWFTPNWSFIAKFDGEFAQSAQTYAGSGTLRYSW